MKNDDDTLLNFVLDLVDHRIPKVNKPEVFFSNKGNSCHLDSFLEACYSCFLINEPFWLCPLTEDEKKYTDEKAFESKESGFQYIMRAKRSGFSQRELNDLRNRLRKWATMHWGLKEDNNKFADIAEWLGIFGSREFSFWNVWELGFINGESYQISITLPSDVDLSVSKKLEKYFSGDFLTHPEFKEIKKPFMKAILFVFTTGKVDAKETVKVKSECGDVWTLKIMAMIQVRNGNHYAAYLRRKDDFFYYDDITDFEKLEKGVPAEMKAWGPDAATKNKKILKDDYSKEYAGDCVVYGIVDWKHPTEK